MEHGLDTKAGATGPYDNHQATAPFVSLGLSVILMVRSLSCAGQVACLAGSTQ